MATDSSAAAVPTEPEPRITGYVHDAWTTVRDAFVTSFKKHGETGAALVVYHKGLRVVDLAGGVADAAGRPYTHSTIQQIFSAGKVFCPVSMMILEERGLIDVSHPVAKYWPEFAECGKGDITIEAVLTHTAGVHHAGIASVYQQSKLDTFAAVIAKSPAVPLPASGEYTSAYHGLTVGVVIGTIVQRVTGLSPDAFWQKEVCEPLGIDSFHYGLQAEDAARSAEFSSLPPNMSNPAFLKWMQRALLDPTAQWHAALTGGHDTSAQDKAGLIKFLNGHARSIGNENSSAFGFANARALARVYAALIGEIDGIRLVKAETLRKFTSVMASGQDWVLQWPVTWGRGFMVKHGLDELTFEASPILWPGSGFYCPGAGGQFGIGDEEHATAIAFTSRACALEPAHVKFASLFTAVKACADALH